MGGKFDCMILPSWFDLPMARAWEQLLAMNRNLLKSFFSDESGTETVEWALMVALIVVGLGLTVAAIGSWVDHAFEHLQEDLDDGGTCCD